jgi:hypothetical protein
VSTLVRTGVAGLAVLAVGYGALTLLGQTRAERMPSPPNTVATRADGRLTVTIQLCWSPPDSGGVVRTALGPGSGKSDVHPRLDCAHPFQRTGTVAKGDQIFVQWIMNPDGPLVQQSATYRITVNNREARMRRVVNGMDYYGCTAGVSPCD